MSRTSARVVVAALYIPRLVVRAFAWCLIALLNLCTAFLVWYQPIRKAARG
jgi:hypothetical protein